MRSDATSVADYLAGLGPERATLVGAVRDLVNAHLPEGYEEGMQYGMIGWFVPHARYPAGYKPDPTQPLPYLALASQARYVSLYMMGLYCGCKPGPDGETPDARWFRDAWTATGRTLDMGKSCVRFRHLSNVPADVLGQAVARIPVATYLARYEQVVGRR